MMSEIKTTEKTETLSEDINTITAEINAYQRVAGEAIFEIGRRLKHVKENDLAHGKYIEWIESIGMNRTTAYRFVKVYEEFGANDDTWQHLSMRALYEIATLPPSERESEHMTAKGEQKKPEDMTVKELRELKRSLKEEREARERAEKLAEESVDRAELSESRAERYRKSSEIAHKKLEDAEDIEPEVRYETKTEYIEVQKEPEDYDEVKRRVREYENKFGDLRNYDDKVSATQRQDMIVAVMSFSKGVRDFAKRYGYMTKYDDVIRNLDEDSIEEYNTAVKAIKELANDFEYTDISKDIIDAEII